MTSYKDINNEIQEFLKELFSLDTNNIEKMELLEIKYNRIKDFISKSESNISLNENLLKMVFKGDKEQLNHFRNILLYKSKVGMTNIEYYLIKSINDNIYFEDIKNYIYNKLDSIVGKYLVSKINIFFLICQSLCICYLCRSSLGGSLSVFAIILVEAIVYDYINNRLLDAREDLKKLNNINSNNAL